MIAWPLQLLIGLSMVLITALCSSIAVSLHSLRRRMTERLDYLERELAKLNATLPREYVLREDWIRAMARFDSKLDRLARHLPSGESHE